MHHPRRAMGSDTQLSIHKLHFVSHLTLGETEGESQGDLNGDVEVRYARD